MTIQEANNIIEAFSGLAAPTTEQRADYAEAMNYLFEQTGDPDFLAALGTMYYEQEMFEFALQYFMLAADKGSTITPLPEIFAGEAEEFFERGMHEDGLTLLDEARRHLARRIAADPLSDDLLFMKQIIYRICKYRKFDPARTNLYDLYHVLRLPRTVQFCYEGNVYEVRSSLSGGGLIILFGDEKYASIDDFFELAAIDGHLLTALCQDLKDFKIVY